MTDYIIDFKIEGTYRLRTSSDKSIEEIDLEIGQQLDDGADPEDLGAYPVDIYVQDVSVREPYEWERWQETRGPND